ncbi:coil containing protein [Vibrio phage 1.213.O._10N.222.54.F10]|nr:coil containing protein [Vibrio phage 1.213.O._10N.222.54.F10]
MKECQTYKNFESKKMEKEPELTKENSPQGVISRISNRLHNIGCEHQDSELGEELGGMACEIWGVLPMISNEEPKQEKPKRVKVEYVKCEFKFAWEAVKAFEDGEEFHTHFISDGWVAVEHVQQVIPNLQVEKLYRRTETEIDERQEFIERAEELIDISKIAEYSLGKMYDAGCRFTD